MGEGVAEGAVSEEKIVNAGLGKDVAEFGGGATVGNGSTGAGGWPELATEFKALKKGTPSGIHGGGIGFPGFVEFLEKSGISRMTEAAQGWGGGGGGAIWVEPFQSFQGGILLG